MGTVLYMTTTTYTITVTNRFTREVRTLTFEGHSVPEAESHARKVAGIHRWTVRFAD